GPGADTSKGDLLSSRLKPSLAATAVCGEEQRRVAHTRRIHRPAPAEPQHQPIAMHRGIADHQSGEAIARVDDMDRNAAELLDPQFRIAEWRLIHCDDEA